MNVVQKQTLTLAAAKKMAEAVEAFAGAQKWNVSIAVVDSGSNLVYLGRMDGAILGSIEIAERKARTAVMYQCPTKDLEAGLAGGMTSLLKLDILPFEGGIPLSVDGQVAGAIGVSGISPTTDGKIAQVGADWFAKAPKP
jgi:glc operon protein GlcG